MNPEHDLLRQLREAAREREQEERRRFGEEWDRLAASELSAEEERELAKRADDSPETALNLAAFRPLGDDFHSSLVDAIEGQRARELAGAGDENVAVEPLPLPPPSARSRRGAWVLGTIGSLAAALALVLVARPAPRLPSYAAELQSGDMPARGGGEGQQPTFAQGSDLELLVRPAIPVSDVVEAHCTVAPAGTGDVGQLRPWPPCARAECDEGGALRIAGRVAAELPFEPGDWTLWVVVARRGLARSALPDAAQLARMAPGAVDRGPGWTAVRLAHPIHVTSD